MTQRRPYPVGRSLVRLLKVGTASAVCLGTLGVALTFVDVGAAFAVGKPTITSVSPQSGLPGGGTSVTIVGVNFNAPAVSVVDFGSTPATSFSISSNTKIIATAPAGSGTVNVTATNADGTSNIVPADLFTWAPPPTVNALYSGNASTAGGSTIIIQGTNFVAGLGTSVLFAGTAATSFSVVSSTLISAVVPAHAAGMGNVTVTTGSGTSPTGMPN